MMNQKQEKSQSLLCSVANVTSKRKVVLEEEGGEEEEEDTAMLSFVSSFLLPD